jgi:hypothetical protein
LIISPNVALSIGRSSLLPDKFIGDIWLGPVAGIEFTPGSDAGCGAGIEFTPGSDAGCGVVLDAGCGVVLDAGSEPGNELA